MHQIDMKDPKYLQHLEIQRRAQQKYDTEVLEKKTKISIEELCQNCPPEMVKFMKYVRKLKFESKPDYKYLHSLIEKVQKDNDIEPSQEIVFDWVTVKQEKLRQREIEMENERKRNEKKIDFVNSKKSSKALLLRMQEEEEKKKREKEEELRKAQLEEQQKQAKSRSISPVKE